MHDKIGNGHGIYHTMDDGSQAGGSYTLNMKISYWMIQHDIDFDYTHLPLNSEFPIEKLYIATKASSTTESTT